MRAQNWMRARLNTPDWLWTRWSAQYGEDIARAIAEAHGKEAPLDITLKSEALPIPKARPCSACRAA